MSSAWLIVGALLQGAAISQSAPSDAGKGEAIRGEAIKGEARLSCMAGGDGSLQACTVISEAPAGQGFGAAAIARAGELRIKTAQDGGPARGRRFTVPMRFEFTRVEAAGHGITAPGVPDTVKNGEWMRRPSGADLAREYPQRAAERGVSGRARVICRAETDGSLSDCEVLDEAPVAYGFGEAVRTLADRNFRLKPLDKEGRPVAGRYVVVPVVLQMSR